MDLNETSKEKLISWFETLHKQVMELKKEKAEMNEVNQKMTILIDELNAAALERKQLSEMGNQLQISQNIEEACAVSTQYIRKFFPGSNGALYLIDPLKDLAEAVSVWGDTTLAKEMFVPVNCWAIRRGRIYVIDNEHPGLLCGHITSTKDGRYLCIPLMAHGNTIGILHLNHLDPNQDQKEKRSEQYNVHTTQLSVAVAESIALSLSNLKLWETLRQQSIRDVLTGLFNRRYMEESLTRELSRADREKTTLGLIMFDIDDFREFNNIFGHDGGDTLLHEMGGFISKRTRGGDIVSRYGGEEFVIVYPRANLEDTKQQAEKLRQSIKKFQAYHLGKPLDKCTISIGVAAYPDHGMTCETLLKSADTALYCAKNEGKDRVVVASNI